MLVVIVLNQYWRCCSYIGKWMLLVVHCTRNVLLLICIFAKINVVSLAIIQITPSFLFLPVNLLSFVQSFDTDSSELSYFHSYPTNIMSPLLLSFVEMALQMLNFISYTQIFITLDCKAYKTGIHIWIFKLHNATISILLQCEYHKLKMGKRKL